MFYLIKNHKKKCRHHYHKSTSPQSTTTVNYDKTITIAIKEYRNLVKADQHM